MNLISLISLAKSYGISQRMQAGNLYPNEFELPCMDVNSLTWEAREVKHIPVDTLGIEPRAFRMHHLYPNEFACPLPHVWHFHYNAWGYICILVILHPPCVDVYNLT